MHIIGIDPSLTCTGISNGEITATIRSIPIDDPDAYGAMNIRIANIVHDIWAFTIAAMGRREGLTTPEPAVLYVESIAPGPNMGHLFEMGWYFATLYRQFACGPFSIHIVNPTTLKKYILKGNLKKSDVPLACYKRWGIEFDGDGGKDKAHAYALHRLGVEHQNGEYELVAPKRRGARKQIAANKRSEIKT